MTDHRNHIDYLGAVNSAIYAVNLAIGNECDRNNHQNKLIVLNA
jgi:hypothetical protein